MSRRKPYKLAKRIGVLFTALILLITALVTIMFINGVAERVRDEELLKMETMVSRLESSISVIMPQIQAIEGDPSLGPQEKFAQMNQLVQPIVDSYSYADPQVNMGYYSKALDQIISISQNMPGYLGRTLSPNHVSRNLYAQAPVQRQIGEVSRGKVARYGRLIYWEGEAVGHLWANIPIESYYARVLDSLGGVLVVILVAIISGVLLSRSVSGEIHRSIEALRKKIDNLASDDPSEDDQELVLPDEFQFLVNRFTEMTQRVESLSSRLEEKTRLASFGEFAAVIVHDIKNPLSAIRANAELGKMTYQMNAIQERFGHIIKASDDIDSFLKKMLQRAKSTPHHERISIAALVRNVAHTWRPILASKGITLDVSTREDEMAVVRGDSMALLQILRNIIRNAADATGEGGRISISCTTQDGLATIAISDTGHGIPVEIQPHLFKHFYTTKEQGTGIGLASAQSVINEHGGKIWFQSQAGEGTTFFIELPLVDPGSLLVSS